MVPTVPELVDFFVRLEDDPNRAGLLDGMPFQIFQAAITEGLVEHLEQDGFASVVGKAVARELIGYERTQAGSRPSGRVWGDHDFQMHSGYYATLSGRQMAALSPAGGVGPQAPASPKTQEGSDQRDCFICHAGEDKDVARPIADGLRRLGYEVWFDEYELGLGDSLRETIEQGLAAARFGVVILSPTFFQKNWPQLELNGLTARETINGERLILPVWHGVDEAFLATISPTLADRVGVSSAPLDGAVEAIAATVERRRKAETD